MPNSDPCFIRFADPVADIELPTLFTYPFCYQPHQLCEIAAHEVQQYLQEQTDWQHDFGLKDQNAHEYVCGKMFGILVVKNACGEIGYLRGFSGKIADSNHLPGFVPPVFDLLSENEFFHQEMAAINAINKAIHQLEQNPRVATLQEQLVKLHAESEQDIQKLRTQMIASRARRKEQRLAASTQSDAKKTELLNNLSRQSVAEKNQLKQRKQHWQTQISELEQCLIAEQSLLSDARQQRKTASARLQHKIFAQYKFLNALGHEKTLHDIFSATSNPTPPAGSGECAAPKMLNYAFEHGYQPLAMAEFWWGKSPKSEIRHHQQFYPSCQSKCYPILSHMLQGLDVEENPLLNNPAEGKEFSIVYQDEAIVVVNKPADFLSVPGRYIKDSVFTRLQQQFVDAEGPFVVHRLDMATSGLLVFALTKRANKQLQKQFITRRVNKRYVALLEGILEPDSGDIYLPLRGDENDRPRQKVCYQHGKEAHTDWQVIERHNRRTKVYLTPHTGRTHQLRMHCAHSDGLNMPIVGDDLYGTPAQRLHLHAETLSFGHPYTKKALTFKVNAPF